jgi:hypothetical protein
MLQKALQSIQNGVTDETRPTSSQFSEIVDNQQMKFLDDAESFLSTSETIRSIKEKMHKPFWIRILLLIAFRKLSILIGFFYP